VTTDGNAGPAPGPAATTGEGREERLARLLSGLADARRAGKPADVDAAAAAHPDVAAELRELWAAVQFADHFARPKAPAARTPRVSPRPPDNPSPCHAPPSHPRAFGDYELQEELGRGGMGVVYRAWHKGLQRPVALKMILRGELATPEDRARFQAEARAAAHLDHPHIVPVYGAGECDGQSYFSMRLVEGQTLAALLSRGPLRATEAARLLLPVCRAVQYAHERGILHRDLKPSNVLLDKDGRPHITDFGLAKRVADPGARTATGAIVGTPAYMAPEQASGRRGTPSPASDVYSLGVILYEALTGRPPFQAASPLDTLLLVLDQDAVRPRLLNPTVDPDLELICLKCLQKAPELRYPSARALADDLEAFLAGEPVSVRAVGWRNFGDLFTRVLRETHHAAVLENWGVLWMWHSLKILLICVLTTWLWWRGVTDPLWYLLLWGGGLVAWGSIFWHLRKRGGPVLFIERQVAHVWGAAIAATAGVFVIEMLLGLPVLTLSPMLAVIAGITFAVKAGMLSGEFYVWSALQFLTAVPMALYPRYGILLFGLVSALGFFVPGFKYHRQRLRASRDEPPAESGGSP
jgi:serine/threonine-protein kinase